MVGVVLAAGSGSRLKKSFGENRFKPLVKVNQKHLIEYSLNNLIALNIKKAYIVVGKQGGLIKEIIGLSYHGISITYICQEEPVGLINALVRAARFIEEAEDVVLQLADEFFVNLKTQLIQETVSTTCYDFYCGITCEDDPLKIKQNYSVELDEKGLIMKCCEKPAFVSNRIKGTGLCIFRSNAIRLLKEVYNERLNEPKDLCDYMNYLVSESKNGSALCVADKEFNINTSFDLLEAETFFRNNQA